jgi:hypothetical protein
MAKRIAGTEPKVPSRPAAPQIDVRRHLDGFREAALAANGLVARLRKGRAVIVAMAADDPDRPDAEELWRDLVCRLAEALRSAYARWSLLRLAMEQVEVLDLWDAHMPTALDLDDAGVRQMLAYWRGRTDPPAWMTPQETALVANATWPPDLKLDALSAGVRDRYEEVPF